MESEIVAFIRDELWKELAPLPWYRSPTSIHMAAVGMFFQFSINIRDMHASMTDDYGIPVWGSYLIFAIATIILGLLIGLVIICLCDAFSRPQYPAASVRHSPRKSPSFTPKVTDASGHEMAAGDADADADVEPSDVEDEDFDLLDDQIQTDVEVQSQPSDSAGPDPGASQSPHSSSESTVRRRETKTPDEANA